LSAWRTLLARALHVEKEILFTIVLAAGGLLLFVELAGDVLEGDTRGFDEMILLAFRNPADPSDPLGPGWVEEMMRDITALGSTVVLAFVSLGVAGFLHMTGKRGAALLVLASVLGGSLLSSGLKISFERARPDLVPHGATVYTKSFPSGHSFLSAVVYLTLGALLARVQPRRRLKIYLLGLAALLTVAIGLSRVYLGVHWPTDVLAGWTVGATWALLCWLVALWLQSRGSVEEDKTA
jgi:undecaprenyl-diphosphatase